jgi:hypothetical protein
MKKFGMWILCAAISSASRGAIGAPIEVEVRPGTLVVKAVAVSAQDAVEALSRAVGAELHGTARNEGTRTIDVHAADVEDALRQLLGGQSYLVRYGRDGTPRRIDLVDTAANAAPVSGTYGATGPGALAVASPPPTDAVRVGWRLAQALGTAQPSLQNVLQAITSASDPAVRGDALEVVAGALGSDPDLASTTLGMLDGLDDESLAMQLRSIVGDHALEVSRQIAQETSLPGLRERMLAVESTLTTK